MTNFKLLGTINKFINYGISYVLYSNIKDRIFYYGNMTNYIIQNKGSETENFFRYVYYPYFLINKKE